MPDHVHVLSISLQPRDAIAALELRVALDRMCANDPTLGVEVGPVNEVIVKGTSETHLEVAIDRLKRETGIAFAYANPQIAYRETIRRPAQAEYTHKQQDPGQYARVKLQLVRLPSGAGIEVENRCSTEALPPAFLTGAEAGIRNACKAGVIAEFPLADLKIVVIDADWEERDSSAAAFEIAARMCLREALSKGDPAILQPVMKVEVVTPQYCMGDVVGDLNSRHGLIQDMDVSGDGRTTITAMVPFANLFGYEHALRTVAQNKASHKMSFAYYEQVPSSPPGGDGDFPMAGALRW